MRQIRVRFFSCPSGSVAVLPHTLPNNDSLEFRVPFPKLDLVGFHEPAQRKPEPKR